MVEKRDEKREERGLPFIVEKRRERSTTTRRVVN